MNRIALFDSPFLLGFERTRALVERAARPLGDAYPPFNVEDRGEGGIRITLAVAGFAAADLAVAVDDNQLTVTGRREPPAADAPARDFVHRGVAARGFVRGFILADGVEVGSAHLEDGLLHIDLAQPEPVRRARSVPIGTAS